MAVCFHLIYSDKMVETANVHVWDPEQEYQLSRLADHLTLIITQKCLQFSSFWPEVLESFWGPWVCVPNR